MRRKLLRAAILFVLVPYVAITLSFSLAQQRLLYRPTVAIELPVNDFLPPTIQGRDVRIDTRDGHQLHGWHLTEVPHVDDVHELGSQTERMLVLYFPGNSLNRAARIDDLIEIVNLGYDLLIFDYRGFGDSTGEPTQSSLTEDAESVYDFAQEKLAFDASQVIIYGESLGGAVAVSPWDAYYKEHPLTPAGFVLNSTFASMSEVVAYHYPYFPFQFVLNDDWCPIENFSWLYQRPPVIIFHGTADKLIPISQARKLASAMRSSELIEIPGGTHNEVPTAALKDAFDRIREMSRERPQALRGDAVPDTP